VHRCKVADGVLDLLISGATVYPGDAPAFQADVGIEAGRIVAVESTIPAAASTVDGRGLVLCPGFIDMHAHSALASFDDPFLTPKLGQGFTTEVINPDGLAPAPVSADARTGRRLSLRPLEGGGPDSWPWTTMAEYFDALDATRPATSLVPSVAHGAVRDLVVGADRVRPTSWQMSRMCRQVELGLDAGARTLSFGLVYVPGAYAETAELDAVAKVAARANAPLAPHVRNEGHGVFKAVEEMIGVARRSDAPLHLSHLKCLDERLVEPLLELLDKAATDIDLTFDQYPYGAGSTMLASLLPTWAQEGGASRTLEILKCDSMRARIVHDIERGLPGWENVLGTLGPERIEIASSASRTDAVGGMTLSEAAHGRHSHPAEAVLDLLVESALDMTMITHYASDDAVRTVARHRLQLVGSDGIFGTHPHPRLYGTAARFLGRLAMRERLLPVEEAVARLTSRAADRLGLHDRGRIAPGKRADLVLLDPARYVDTATYARPKQLPDGVVGVWVRGEAAWWRGATTGLRLGGVVR
jgi:N-acyl-D-amino-acid deacylase